MDKYEYLTGEDLGLKPSTIEQTKFEYSPLGKFFYKGLDKNDLKEGLFKRPKNIENIQKGLIGGDDKDKDKKQQNNNNIDTKPPNVSNYLKRLSQEVKDLMDEIEEANHNIDSNKLLFIGGNREKCNFNTFKIILNFLSAIYNGQISLKDAEFKQRGIEKNRGSKRL